MQGLHTASLAFTSPIHRIYPGQVIRKYIHNSLGLRLLLNKILTGIISAFTLYTFSQVSKAPLMTHKYIFYLQ